MRTRHQENANPAASCLRASGQSRRCAECRVGAGEPLRLGRGARSRSGQRGLGKARLWQAHVRRVVGFVGAFWIHEERGLLQRRFRSGGLGERVPVAQAAIVRIRQQVLTIFIFIGFSNRCFEKRTVAEALQANTGNGRPTSGSRWCDSFSPKRARHQFRVRSRHGDRAVRDRIYLTLVVNPNGLPINGQLFRAAQPQPQPERSSDPQPDLVQNPPIRGG